ncbi:MAG: response regulator [Taibaiella sp.]|nr:response regulator [Taibaiella sp.]
MLTGYKILVAEDNTLNQRIATLILNKQGAKVTTVLNGLEALRELGRNSYDLILMDLQMPEMDGFETANYIRNVLKSKVPIIALSASTLENEYDRCIEAGMCTCIIKPLDKDKLATLIVALTKEKVTST